MKHSKEMKMLVNFKVKYTGLDSTVTTLLKLFGIGIKANQINVVMNDNFFDFYSENNCTTTICGVIVINENW